MSSPHYRGLFNLTPSTSQFSTGLCLGESRITISFIGVLRFKQVKTKDFAVFSEKIFGIVMRSAQR